MKDYRLTAIVPNWGYFVRVVVPRVLVSVRRDAVRVAITVEEDEWNIHCSDMDSCIKICVLILVMCAVCQSAEDEENPGIHELGGVSIKVFRGPSKSKGGEVFAPFGYHVKMPAPVGGGEKEKDSAEEDDDEDVFKNDDDDDDVFKKDDDDDVFKKDDDDDDDVFKNDDDDDVFKNDEEDNDNSSKNEDDDNEDFQ
ncbi:hypothetical protein CDAR_260891 [Caerostris darwini]|uniref:Uncharacterized protein n=1 Tax=Caerostris darwini TaxID=1538125 RepID=A0AAV4MFP3_9ARAC|nr:hypothetical protein CDAR_260891 [Caerostris darwini]